jgi:zona occludens toxin (predicted ATPase)
MITIFSGVPGSGKTALIVDMIMDEVRAGRKVFTIGIPKLLLDVQSGGDPHKWHDGSWLKIDQFNPDLTKKKGIESQWFPRGCPTSCEFLGTCPRVGSLNKDLVPDSGSLIVIDESHVYFPQRASGKAPPPYVEALNVHRHQGLDIWFISQRPSFLDPFVRGLSSRHIHLGLNAFSFTGKRIKYEWAEYQETLNRTSKLMASKSDYKPSAAVFPLYASSTVHTKLDQRMPTILKMFILAVLVFITLVGLAVSRVNARVESIKNPAPLVAASDSGGQRSGQTVAVAATQTANIPSPLPTSSVSPVLALNEIQVTRSPLQLRVVRGFYSDDPNASAEDAHLSDQQRAAQSKALEILSRHGI